MNNKEMGEKAAEVLPLYVHAPLADVTIHPMSNTPGSTWCASWAIDGQICGNIWWTRDFGGGWHASVNLPGNGHAELGFLGEGEALPTTARLVLTD
jgi:hypothetical protein